MARERLSDRAKNGLWIHVCPVWAELITCLKGTCFVSELKMNRGKKMKRVKMSIMLLVLLLAGMIFVPAVSAATVREGATIGWNATPEQVVRLNELWGKNITIGEYFEEFCPQCLVGMPPDLKEVLYKNRWKWNGAADN